MAFDGAGAVGHAEAGDDGVEVLAEAGHEGVQGGQVVALDTGNPLVQVPALTVVHELGERADVVGGAIERGAAGQNRLEALGLVVGETVGVPGEPASHVPHRGCLARRIEREGFAELGHVLLHDALAAGLAVLAYFLEQPAADGAALGPPLVEVGLVGVEDAGAAGPPPDQELVCARRVGEAADGIASQPELTADRSQPNSLVEESVDSSMWFPDSVGQPARCPQCRWREWFEVTPVVWTLRQWIL